MANVRPVPMPNANIPNQGLPSAMANVRPVPMPSTPPNMTQQEIDAVLKDMAKRGMFLHTGD